MQYEEFNIALHGTVTAYSSKIQLCCLLLTNLHAFTPYCFLAQPKQQQLGESASIVVALLLQQSLQFSQAAYTPTLAKILRPGT